VIAVVAGTAVWIALAAALVGWTVVTLIAGARRGLPRPRAVVRWFLDSWLGRVLILIAWAGSGWHVFCQRP
jgi:ammonia channel protein AmtB